MIRVLSNLAISTAVFAAGVGAASNSTAEDTGRTVVGVLNCQESGGWGLVLGSSRTVRCTFTDANGRSEAYRGRISKVGVDIGYQHSGVIIWTVLAPASGLGSGALKGQYAGATASVAVAVGGGANVLVGGSGRSISLQPVSFEGLTGINVAGGVEALTLDFGA